MCEATLAYLAHGAWSGPRGPLLCSGWSMELNSQGAGRREEREADNEKTFTRYSYCSFVSPRGGGHKHVRQHLSI